MPEGDNRNMISVMRPFSTMGHQLAGKNPRGLAEDVKFRPRNSSTGDTYQPGPFS
jgi:hypothetical protein